jgi:hypothetical protein
MNTLSQYSQSQGRDMNPLSPEYDAGVLALTVTFTKNASYVHTQPHILHLA